MTDTLIMSQSAAMSCMEKRNADSRADGFIRPAFRDLQTVRIEILIVVRNYGFVDCVELIPPGQLLRVPSHPPDRSVLVDYPELHLASRILPRLIATLRLLLPFTPASFTSSLAYALVLQDDPTGYIATLTVV